MIIETIYEWKSSQKTQSFHRDSTQATPEYKVTQYATEELSKELLEQSLYFSKKVVKHIPNRCSDRMKEVYGGSNQRVTIISWSKPRLPSGRSAVVNRAAQIIAP